MDKEQYIPVTAHELLMEHLSRGETVLVTINATDTIKHTKYFIKNTDDFFDAKTNELTLLNCVENVMETLNEANIDQFTTHHDSQASVNKAAKAKTAYDEILKEYNEMFDITGIYCLTKLDKLKLICNVSAEDLNNDKGIQKAKQIVMKAVEKKVEEEKENLRKEFSVVSEEEESEFQQNELHTIISFVEQTSKDESIFNEAKTAEEVLACWPTILQPSPFVNLLSYINKGL